jgi:hypothetical protein
VASTLAQLKANEEIKAALDAFVPQTLTVGDSALLTHPVYVATTEFLRSWQADNYGRMAGVITHMFAPITPKDVRNEYQGHTLEEHEVLSLDHHAAAPSASPGFACTSMAASTLPNSDGSGRAQTGALQHQTKLGTGGSCGGVSTT